MTVAGGLNFGGPSSWPSGRGDNDVGRCGHDQFSTTGKSLTKVGGEFRQFLNNIFRSPTGSFNFLTVADSLTGTANAFNVTLGNQSSSVDQAAFTTTSQTLTCSRGI